MFVDNDSFFEKSFYAKVYDSKKVDAVKVPSLPDAKRTKEAIAKLEGKGFSLHTVKFKMLTWGEYTRITKECIKNDPESMMKYLDTYEHEFKKLCAVLIEWDFMRVNSEGERVKTKPDEKTIRSLNPVVAELLLKLYDEEGDMSPEMEKNS
jgi:hypothetical protein